MWAWSFKDGAVSLYGDSLARFQYELWPLFPSRESVGRNFLMHTKHASVEIAWCAVPHQTSVFHINCDGDHVAVSLDAIVAVISVPLIVAPRCGPKPTFKSCFPAFFLGDLNCLLSSIDRRDRRPGNIKS
jgi:hypothetical protein